MKAHIHVTLKRGVLDPEGKAINNALGGLGFGGVENVRKGKYITLDLSETDKDQALSQVTQMCEKLLANTVIEDYSIKLEA
jgi:phosphoribosylformylglycinamidine synthase